MSFEMGKILELVRGGIFGIINSHDHKIDVRHTSNLMQAITRNVVLLARGEHTCRELQKDRDKLEFQILEKIDERQPRLLAHGKWIDIFKDMEWTLYREKPALTLTAKLQIIDYLFHVRIVNRHGDGYSIGVFDNKDEAASFAKKYNDQKYSVPIYAENQLTKDVLGR